MSKEQPIDSEADLGAQAQAGAQRKDLALTPTQLAATVAAVLAGAFLLRLQPVRSVAKLGALGAVAWTGYRFAQEIGLLSQASETVARRAERKLAASSQRLAEAWGAHYRAPHLEGAVSDVEGGKSPAVKADVPIG